jgi:hypothetical protein
MLPPELRQSAFVRYSTHVLNPDGSFARRGQWKRNLILDGGLDGIAVRAWAESFTYAAIGTGTNPVKRDSGSTTFSRSGDTVTASASFFESADVGRLLKVDSGEEMYITAYGSGTSVTVNASGTLAASEGTVYYVNRTALQTEAKRTKSCRTNSGDNGSTWSSANKTWTHQRSFIFSAESGPVTYREIGWSWGSGSTALFGMDLIPGGGDSLVAGQQYLVIVQLVVAYSPATPTTAPDVGSGGWNTSGQISLGDVRQALAISYVDANGNANGGGGTGLEPSVAGFGAYSNFSLFTNGAYTLPEATNGAVSVPAGIMSSANNYACDAYTSGTFTRTKSVKFGVSEAYANHWGACIYNGYAPTVLLVVKFTAAQAKANTHTLEIRFRFSWGRTLVN